jgi:mycothiol synthase
MNTFTIRPFSLEADIPAILRLRAAVEAVDQQGVETSEAELRAQLALPGHDPAQDRWVAELPGNAAELAGYALVWVAPGADTAHTNVVVHPEYRRQGLGTTLLHHALQRGLALGATQAEIYANASHPAAGSFLRKHGFAPQGAYTEMRASIPARLPAAVWPYGYTLKTYAEVQDIAILTQAFNRSYAGLWGHHPDVSETQMAGWLAEFDPNGLFLVFSPSGKVVGVSRVERNADRSARNHAPTGYIDAPGLHHHHRRMDLYRALLLTGLHWLQGQEQTLVELESWGDKAEILKLYGEFGFTTLRQEIGYRRSLKP